MAPVIGITTSLRTIAVSAGEARAHTLVTTYTTMVRRAAAIQCRRLRDEGRRDPGATMTRLV